MTKLSMAGLVAVLAAALVVFISSGCTMTPDTYPIATVNGEVVSLQDLETYPGFKAMVDKLVQQKLIQQRSAKEGVQVDPARLDEELNKMKEQIGPGPSYQQWLVESNITEQQLRQQIGLSLMFEGLLKRQVVVTEEEVKANFEQNPKFLRQMYGQEKHLTSEESENLTYEEMKDWLIEYMKRSRAYSQAQDLMDSLMNEADIDYLFMSPEARAALKKQQQEARKEAEAAKHAPITITENGSGEKPTEAEGEPEVAPEEGAPAEKTEQATEEKGAPAEEGEAATGEEGAGDGSEAGEPEPTE